MSDTPKTDSAKVGNGQVDVAFARWLERELNQARLYARKWRDHWASGDTLRKIGGIYALPWEDEPASEGDSHPPHELERELNDATELLTNIMKGECSPEDEAEKWLRAYAPERLR